MTGTLTSAWRSEFPGLQQLAAEGQTWLDSAATAQKPRVMLDALQHWYAGGVANVHRSQHRPGERATTAFEQARRDIANWLGCDAASSLVFTRGTTESINLLAYSLSTSFHPGDEILVGAHEHHANLLPWQQLARRKNLVLRILPLDAAGALDMPAALAMFGPRSRLLAVSPLSNVLGHMHDLTPLLQRARELGVLSVVDGAQYAVHRQPNLAQLDADFLSARPTSCTGQKESVCCMPTPAATHCCSPGNGAAKWSSIATIKTPAPAHCRWGLKPEHRTLAALLLLLPP